MTDRRNGLTDEQYQYLWSIGKNPQISQKAARDWMFRAGRYTNVVDWLGICGKTNDFAKLSHKLQGDNFALEETNAVVVSENKDLWRTNAIVVAENVVLTEENEILVATNAVLEVDAKKAKTVEKAAEKAKKKDQKNFQKWVSDTEKAKSKSSDEMAEFYDAVLELSHAYEEAL